MAGPARRQLPQLFGSDISQVALAAARANLEAAGVLEFVQLDCADATTRPAPAPSGVLIANPPYGVRIGDRQHLLELYPQLGDALKQRFSGWRAYLFSADLELPKHIRLKASKRTPLFNGALECRLFEYRMVSGALRREPVAANRDGASASEESPPR
jgi:putative N6-adenine-specific DNA methylase